MRQALQDVANRPAERSYPADFPAPTLGWNSAINIAQTPPGYAITMKNFIPYPDKCLLRGGTEDHVTGFTAGKVIETLMAYRPSGTGGKLFAATDQGIYDATSAGTVGAVSSSATNARWQWVNFANSANNYLICVNGVDDYRYWNGSAWTTVATFGSLATNTLIGVEVYQQRLFFVAKNSKLIYFLPAGAVTGTASLPALNLEQLMRRGGYVMAIGTWTLDSGSGLDDKFVVVTSEGEVIIFQGYDPSSASTWSYVGTYYIGRPIGRRCLTKMSGDLLVLTERGLFPLSKAIQSTTVEATSALSYNIEPDIVRESKNYYSSFGWEVLTFPRDQLLLVNIPSSAKKQYVMQLQTKGWCEFGEIDASCWCEYAGNLYYGTTAKVRKAQSGQSDSSSAIAGIIEYAYGRVDGSTRLKVPSAVLPVLQTTGDVQYKLGVSADFVQTQSFNTIVAVAPGSTAGVWDTSYWDAAYYGGDLQTVRNWTTVPAKEGSFLSPYFYVSTAMHSVAWVGMQMLYHRGGLM